MMARAGIRLLPENRLILARIRQTNLPAGAILSRFDNRAESLRKTPRNKMSIWKLPAALIMVAMVTGCGPSDNPSADAASDQATTTNGAAPHNQAGSSDRNAPVLDTGTEASLQESLDRVRSSLPEDQRIEFDQSVKLIMDVEPQRLHGMTAEQVLAAGRQLHQRTNGG